jgi:hypothetical protein
MPPDLEEFWLREHDAALARKVHEELINAIHSLGSSEDCPYGNCRRVKDTVHDPWGCVKCIAEFLRSSKYGKPEEGKEGSKIMYCPHCGTNSEVSTIRCQTEYPEFSIFTCYNCGKTHIRDVKEGLLVKACAFHPLKKPDQSHYHDRFQEH